MRAPIHALLCTATLLLGASAGGALADDWTLSKFSGQVTVLGPFGGSLPVATGMAIATGDTIATGANGRALLVHSQDTVVVSPDTSLAVPLWGGLGVSTTLVQRSGQIELDVEKLASPHLGVRTPFLAAVVKGTHFTVTVSPGAARVAVDRGVVEVSDFATGQVAAVQAGGVAEVDGLSPLAVTGAAVSSTPSLPSPSNGRSSTVRTASADGNGNGNDASDHGIGNGNGHGSGDDGNHGDGGGKNDHGNH